MDVFFRNVSIISIEPQSDSCLFPHRLMVHLDNVDEDDLFESISDEVDQKRLVEHFLLNDLVEKMDESEKEELVDKIGEKFIKKYLNLTEKE